MQTKNNFKRPFAISIGPVLGLYRLKIHWCVNTNYDWTNSFMYYVHMSIEQSAFGNNN